MHISAAPTPIVSPNITPEAGPSTVPFKANGHTTNGATNGFVSSTTPSPSSNGLTHRPLITRVNLPGSTLYDDSHIDREEFVRLVIQTLRDVGYTQSATTLEEESGYAMETPPVAHFRRKVLEGAWQEAVDALADLGLAEDSGLTEAKCLIIQQKYLELLETGKTTEALHILRDELASLHPDATHLHFLSGLLMCTDAADLQQRASWDGAEGSSRRRLLVDLQHWIPSSIMIPPRRFPALLDQALRYQSSQCLWHNTPARSLSLYNDHHCEDDLFPRHNTFNLVSHEDEVWNLEWSHTGRRLATASQDKSVIVWSVEQADGEVTIQPQLHLKDHPFAVGCVAWSFDDTVLLSSSDHIIKMWDTKTGSCIRSIETAHTETVSALAWVPDGSGFVSGSQDRKIILWGADGKQRDSWGFTPIRITDLAISADYTRLVAVGECAPSPSALGGPSSSREDSATPPAPGRTAFAGATSSSPRLGEYQMIVYDPRTKQMDFAVPLEGQLTSVKISADSRYALINNAPDEIHLWDLLTQRMVRKYTGQRQGRHIIRSCFGGVDENFIVSGSEGAIYVWHRVRGMLLIVLEGHGPGSVNSVAWNPRFPQMFASCSDDYTVRIWQAIPAVKLAFASTSDGIDAGAGDGVSGKGKGKRREPWDNPSSL
ncbi:WD40 repeat-like protein [Vararia minispora EC-137]|uniref:WD40 repeat-like protein n=1 Tax=Vararia minispora EC-137 TaxID=1314806 RepID=A0ACB8QKD9_9AGAM|nr:WD40 repeat-like protein [Vararia minispora EC-137]